MNAQAVERWRNETPAVRRFHRLTHGAPVVVSGHFPHELGDDGFIWPHDEPVTIEAERFEVLWPFGDLTPETLDRLAGIEAE